MNVKAEGTEQNTQGQVEKTPDQIALEEKEAEAGFEAGFTGKTVEPEKKADETKAEGSTPSPDDAARQAAEKKAAEDAAAKATADAAAAAQAEKDKEWDGVPKVVRERLEKLDALPSQIASQIDKLSGHIGNFKQQLTTITSTAKAAADAKGADAPSEVEIQEALVDPDKFKQLQEDFPEWMKPITAEITSLRKSVREALKGVKVAPAATVEKAEPIDTNAIVAEAEERAYVRMKHPDWKAICKTPEFASRDAEGKLVGGWLSKQPADIRALAASDYADDAIKLFDTYKAHRQKLADDEAARLKQDKRLQAAVVVKGSAEPPSTGISDDEAFVRGFTGTGGKR